MSREMTLENIKDSGAINTYIKVADRTVSAPDFTELNPAYVTLVLCRKAEMHGIQLKLMINGQPLI